MTVESKIFDEILFGSLSPWKGNVQSERDFCEILINGVRANKGNVILYFKALDNALKEYSIRIEYGPVPENGKMANLAKPASQQNYNLLRIPDHYNKTSEFYRYLIDNESERIRFEISNNINEDESYEFRYFHVYHLMKRLEYFMEEVGKKIYPDRLSLYVLDGLKITLFRLYEEIRDEYREYLKGDELTVVEIIELMMPEYKVKKTDKESAEFKLEKFLIEKGHYKEQNFNVIDEEKTSDIDIKKKETEKQNSNDDKVIQPFSPRLCDFRDGFNGKVSYENINNKAFFASFEGKLYENEYIDIDYNFTNKHNKKKELAAIYAILIKKNYFKRKDFKYKKDFNDFDFRQYLDHRYNVDTSQQFSRNDDDFIKKLEVENYWIDKLVSC